MPAIVQSLLQAEQENSPTPLSQEQSQELQELATKITQYLDILERQLQALKQAKPSAIAEIPSE